MNLHEESALALHRHFVAGNYSAGEIADHFLARIARYDGEIGAFLAVYEARARAQAELLDGKRKRGERLGRLAGVPIAIKDNIHVKGELTTCGSKFLSNYRAPFHATVVQLLENEGAIILGKTNLDEFAMGSSTENSALKVTRNPWDLQCVPGGSSGGSSAAVAARLALIALGSDTGGSIRQPAAFCGVVGLKPSYGRVSRYGLVAFGSSLDQVGPMATSVEDIGFVMETLGQHDPRDATSFWTHPEEYLSLMAHTLRGKRVGIPWNFLADLSLEAKANFQASLEKFKALDAVLVDIDLDILRYSVATYYIIATAEASTNLARFDGIRYGKRSAAAQTLEEIFFLSREEGFGPEVKKRILLGTYVLSAGAQEAFYKKAQKVRAKIVNEYAKAFERCDVIATPCSPIPAFRLGEIQDPLQMYLQDIYTIGPNLAGLPSISVPSGFNTEGKPWGLQLTGAVREDAFLCHMAHSFEQVASLHKAAPPQFR